MAERDEAARARSKMVKAAITRHLEGNLEVVRREVSRMYVGPVLGFMPQGTHPIEEVRVTRVLGVKLLSSAPYVDGSRIRFRAHMDGEHFLAGNMATRMTPQVLATVVLRGEKVEDLRIQGVVDDLPLGSG